MHTRVMEHESLLHERQLNRADSDTHNSQAVWEANSPASGTKLILQNQSQKVTRMALETSYEMSISQTEVHKLLRLHSIQGVTGGMCETSGECSLGQTMPI
jgi:hypothetical protein